MKFSFLAFLLSYSYVVHADDYKHDPDQVCLATCAGSGSSEVCTFNFKLNQFASELGYYTVDDCEGIMPVLGMKLDVQYRFVQEDESNYYHPLGFAYEADGAHAGVDELEPSIVPPGSSSTCGDDNTCPAPMYINSGSYLGVYSNIEEIATKKGDEDFGLDVYEPQFFASPPDWVSAGTYEVAVKFDVTDFTKDILYFCHIHQYMSGRIKWVDSAGDVIQAANDPVIPYEYEEATPYDQTCGTYGVSLFQLPHAECPKEFVCGEPSGVNAFAGCIDSMNCAMTAGMTTNASSDSAQALFVHQMIPHHQNAVNMAKALLNSGELDECTDMAEETAACTLKVICYEIITGQNHQIQSMRGAVDELGYEGKDDCQVGVSSPDGAEFTLEISTKKLGAHSYCAQPAKSGNGVVVYKCSGYAKQMWKVVDGHMQASNGKCMTNKGINVILQKCTDTMSDPTMTLDGTKIAMVTNSGTKFLNLGGVKNNENSIKLKKSKDSAAQKWVTNYVKSNEEPKLDDD